MTSVSTVKLSRWRPEFIWDLCKLKKLPKVAAWATKLNLFPQISRDSFIMQEYKKDQQLTDRVPIKEILREPPMSCPRSRRPFVIEAARLANLNQTEQDTWEQSWIQEVPPGHDLVTDPTCPQSGFTLPRRQFVTLNRLRCGQARRTESLHRWGVIT